MFQSHVSHFSTHHSWIRLNSWCRKTEYSNPSAHRVMCSMELSSFNNTIALHVSQLTSWNWKTIIKEHTWFIWVFRNNYHFLLWFFAKVTSHNKLITWSPAMTCLRNSSDSEQESSEMSITSARSSFLQKLSSPWHKPASVYSRESHLRRFVSGDWEKSVLESSMVYR